MNEITTRNGEELRVVNHNTASEMPDLYSLHELMQKESGMLLPTTIDSLRASYDAGLAAVLVNLEGEPVGFARFSVLLDDRKKEALGLPESFPDILEFGSAFIHPDYRGGVYGAFKNEVLQLVIKGIKQRKVLVLGTTKWFPVIQATLHAREIGVNFSQIVHTDLDMLAPFTCTCNPDFGSGFHRGPECFQRINHDELNNLSIVASERRGKIPCTMSVSDISLAREMNASLQQHFQKINSLNPQSELVNALLREGHYN